MLFCRINHKTGNPTRGVAAVCVERQHLDELVVGAGGQQLTAVAPGHAVDGALVVFVPPEANRRLLDGAAAGGHRRGHAMRIQNSSILRLPSVAASLAPVNGSHLGVSVSG